MWNDTMGDDRNITLKMLAESAIASDMGAKETIEAMQDSLESIKPEELEKEIEKLKTAGEHPNDSEHKA